MQKKDVSKYLFTYVYNLQKLVLYMQNKTALISLTKYKTDISIGRLSVTDLFYETD